MKRLAPLILLLSGCLSPLQTPPIEPDDRIVEPAELPSITVTASQDAFSEIRAWLGDANTVTLKDSASIVRDDVTVRIPAGATCSYSFTDDTGTFQFAKPLPNVVASVIGFRVSPTLSQIVLRVDGSGTAKTGLGSYKFRWLTDEESGAQLPEVDTRNVVHLYTTPGCAACDRLKRDFTAAKSLPFMLKESAAPAWVKSFPTLHWSTPNGNGKQINGWGDGDSVATFIRTWEATQKRQEASAANNSFQPRADQRRVGSRSAALNLSGHWSGPFRTRAELIDHLNDGIHHHSKRELEGMTNEDLLRAHDADHEGQRASSSNVRSSGLKRGLFPSIGAALFGD